MTSKPQHQGSRQAGMALIAVLWIVAALSLLVVGMSQTVRQQIRLVGTQNDEVRGQALGEAAVMLALQELQVTPERPRGLVQVNQQFDGVDMTVEVMPLGGLISLNGANALLLASAFKVATGMNASAAEALANELVAWRGEASDGGERRWFEAVEDLLLVPGVNYALYERVSPLFTTITRNAGVNPMAAPPEVLAVLADGNIERASNIAQRRAESEVGIDTSALNQGFLASGVSDEYRLSVRVPLEGGKILLLTRDVGLSRTPAGEPWRVFSAMRRILPSSSS
ncbi:type II secretion system protein GspK [Ottowia caeni]|uniref:general secretion pathway protein GspK n=1 Tax=Ottowia caeni TaxID=2870339 RepID=UPI001E59F312|nr:general secretion pathway protein GspK [Ottowia caeni]